MKITETMMDEVDRGYLQTVLDHKNYINPFEVPPPTLRLEVADSDLGPHL